VTTDAHRLQWLANNIVPYEGGVRSWLNRHARTLSAADADDIIQEAYARIWVLPLDSIKHPRAYFSTIIKNLVAEQARRAKIVPMERMGEIEALQIASEEPSPERHASAREALEQLRDTLDTLPPQCRRAFELRKVEGLSIHQTAETLGVTDSAVEKLLARALAKILETMSEAEAAPESQPGSSSERVYDSR
jgi:RNA polymerase sigma factor (sigma-70 family)